MSSPLEKGRAKGAGWICPAGASFYVAENVLLAGIVSHMWHEILRLSPHLFRLGLFTHRAVSSAQDDDTRGRKGFHLGDTLRVLELSVLYTIRVGPWRRPAPKAQDGSTKRCERLCEITRLPPVIPTEVEGALLYGGGFAAFLEDGNLVSQPSPLGEGARKGRIG